VLVVQHDGRIDTVINDGGESFRDIATTPDNQIVAIRMPEGIIIGWAQAADSSESVGRITRFTADGAIVWDMQTEAAADPIALGVDANGAAYVYLQGMTSSVMKLDAQGNTLWTCELGRLRLEAMSVTGDGHVFVTGKLWSGGTLTHTDFPPQLVPQPLCRLAMIDQDGRQAWTLDEANGFYPIRHVLAIDGDQVVLIDSRPFSLEKATSWFGGGNFVGTDGVLRISGTSSADRVKVADIDGMVTATIGGETLTIPESDVRGV
jgi:hypothetical protein